MNEAKLKADLVHTVRQMFKKFVVERSEDRQIHGIPDINITGNKRNSRWEVKHANPGFECRGIQELMMIRLDLAGYARFIVYWEKGEIKRTYIVKPSDIGKPIEEWDTFTEGFSHIWVVEAIRKVHYDNYG